MEYPKAEYNRSIPLRVRYNMFMDDPYRGTFEYKDIQDNTLQDLLDMTMALRSTSETLSSCGSDLIRSIESLLEPKKGGATDLDQAPPAHGGGFKARRTLDDRFFDHVEKTFSEGCVMIGLNPDLTRFRRCDAQLMQIAKDTMVNVYKRYNKENKTTFELKYVMALEHAPKSHIHFLIDGIPNDLIHYIDIGLRRKIGITFIEYAKKPHYAVTYTLKSYHEPFRLEHKEVRFLEAIKPFSIYYSDHFL